MKPVLLSGIQPSGELNVGSYIGAIRNWVKLQDDHDCLFMIVDLHTITVRQDPLVLQARCYDSLALYLACGINPDKSLVFLQSQVAQHSQLAWILNCYTAMGELNRMTQFKDKSKQHEKNINVGLFDYPVLMAADILLYNTNLVPVGEDQKQHLELCRDIALRFNNLYGDIFLVPEPYIPPLGARIMSLQDPNKKMSKSDENTQAAIALLDSPKRITQKIMRAVTDSGSEVKKSADKPGISNLLTLYSVLADISIEKLEIEYSGKGYGDFKKALAEVMVSTLEPIQKKYQELRQDQTYLYDLLSKAASTAQLRAQKKINQVHSALGLII